LRTADNNVSQASVPSIQVTNEDSLPQRIGEIDFLKSMFIILMVTFHLTLIGKTYPFVKQVVYTFHMPGFLIISGYFIRPEKSLNQFLHGMFWLFVPYAIMETAYIVMAYFLPVTDHIDCITPTIVLHYLLIAPLGPYWYLHTLILCSTIGYFVLRFTKLSLFSRFLVLGVFYWVFSFLGLISLSCALYFLGGIVIRQTHIGFSKVFRSSALAFVPIVLICTFTDSLSKENVQGVLMTYLVMCFFLFLYQNIRGNRIAELMTFIGRHTLVILLFSPIFTAATKVFQPFFLFDASRLVFMVVAVIFTISGSLTLAWMLDICHFSRFFFGKQRILA